MFLRKRYEVLSDKVFVAFVFLFLFFVWSRVFAQTEIKERDIGSMLPRCSSPVVSVSLGKFTCKAQGCQKPAAASGQLGVLIAMAQAQELGGDFSNIGEGMSNALITALKATSCFDVQEREALEELRKEMELAGLEFKPKAADYLITGAITAVGIETRKSSFGGGFIPIIGGITSTTRSANLAFELRVIDVKAGSVKSSKSFQANSATSNWGVGGGGVVGGGIVGGAYSVSKNPEMDRVAAETVVYATNFLVDALIPANMVTRPTVSSSSSSSSSASRDAKGNDVGKAADLSNNVHPGEAPSNR